MSVLVEERLTYALSAGNIQGKHTIAIVCTHYLIKVAFLWSLIQHSPGPAVTLGHSTGGMHLSLCTTKPNGQAQPGMQAVWQGGLGSAHVPSQGAQPGKYIWPLIGHPAGSKEWAAQLCMLTSYHEQTRLPSVLQEVQFFPKVRQRVRVTLTWTEPWRDASALMHHRCIT